MGIRRCSATSRLPARGRRAAVHLPAQAARGRIHILEGFVTIFDALDPLIKLIRTSDGKEDAAAKIIKQFKLDEVQTDAILELKLYKLAKLEIMSSARSSPRKTGEAKKIKALLKSEDKLWTVIKDELRATAAELDSKRRTDPTGAGDEVTFDADRVHRRRGRPHRVTRDGWIKRVRELKDPNQTRVREGDEVTHVLPGSTKEKVISSPTAARVTSSRSTTSPRPPGYGDPAQKYFKFATASASCRR